MEKVQEGLFFFEFVDIIGVAEGEVGILLYI